MIKRGEALRRVLEVLDRLKIPYFVHGSLASAAHGIGRSTQDADFVADLTQNQLGDLIAELQRDFYADPTIITGAFECGQAFDLIHFATGFKIDILPLTNDPFSRMQFSRRRCIRLTLRGEPVECAIASAEDTILSKLRWFKIGGQSSTMQWHDVWGIVQVQRDKLDYAYLREWAPKLSVADLLERLLRESS
jgi:hypothetical protein